MTSRIFLSGSGARRSGMLHISNDVCYLLAGLGIERRLDAANAKVSWPARGLAVGMQHYRRAIVAPGDPVDGVHHNASITPLSGGIDVAEQYRDGITTLVGGSCSGGDGGVSWKAHCCLEGPSSAMSDQLSQSCQRQRKQHDQCLRVVRCGKVLARLNHEVADEHPKEPRRDQGRWSLALKDAAEHTSPEDDGESTEDQVAKNIGWCEHSSFFRQDNNLVALTVSQSARKSNALAGEAA